MPTIKGPLVIKKGDVTGFLKERQIGGATLPFKASGWKSEHMPVPVEVDPKNLPKKKGAGK